MKVKRFADFFCVRVCLLASVCVCVYTHVCVWLFAEILLPFLLSFQLKFKLQTSNFNLTQLNSTQLNSTQLNSRLLLSVAAAGVELSVNVDCCSFNSKISKVSGVKFC